ncbi:hypothetical protein JKF63_04511 [Porcisia hertigi]|uniref:Uncharacterized protein n=1 Tax=Porcisia hertigi TaxID=2761500 RepID=A0A836L8R8_9TRYP|nr:hypothetical protein JKF63_04511 [Porcisia hertigi]
MDAADALLLSLEVEAAAARNAELSQTVEVLQDEVLRLRNANASLLACDARQQPKSSEQSVSATHAVARECHDGSRSSADAREAFLILDDLFFEVADIRSRIDPDERVVLTPRAFHADTTLAERATRCLKEVRKLKEAFIVEQHSKAAQVSALQRAFCEQAEANGKRRAAAAGVECASLDHSYAEQQQQRSQEVAMGQGEVMLDRVIRSSLRPS